jgi:hypothetical protein
MGQKARGIWVVAVLSLMSCGGSTNQQPFWVLASQVRGPLGTLQPKSHVIIVNLAPDIGDTLSLSFLNGVGAKSQTVDLNATSDIQAIFERQSLSKMREANWSVFKETQQSEPSADVAVEAVYKALQLAIPFLAQPRLVPLSELHIDYEQQILPPLSLILPSGKHSGVLCPDERSECTLEERATAVGQFLASTLVPLVTSNNLLLLSMGKKTIVISDFSSTTTTGTRSSESLTKLDASASAPASLSKVDPESFLDQTRAADEDPQSSNLGASGSGGKRAEMWTSDTWATPGPIGSAVPNTGAFTATRVKSLNSIQFADQFPGANPTQQLDSAVADCADKPCVVIIPSTMGAGCPTTSNARLSFWDFRGDRSDCTQNVAVWNKDDGNVSSMVKEQMQTNTIADHGAAVSHWFLTFLSNAKPGSGSVLDGASTEAITSGSLSGTLALMSGNESVSLITSTGGNISVAEGVEGYVGDSPGRTTGIAQVRGVDGIGCHSIVGTPKPTACFGLYGREQFNQAASRNYSIGLEGLGLLKYSSYQGKSGLDIEDMEGGTHPFIYFDVSHRTVLAAAHSSGLFFASSDGKTRASITSSGVSIPSSLQVGPAGTIISDSSRLAQFSAALITGAGSFDEISVAGVTPSSHCSVTATNETAATNITTTYVANKGADKITIAHASTPGMTYDILCTAD